MHAPQAPLRLAAGDQESHRLPVGPQASQLDAELAQQVERTRDRVRPILEPARDQAEPGQLVAQLDAVDAPLPLAQLRDDASERELEAAGPFRTRLDEYERLTPAPASTAARSGG